MTEAEWLGFSSVTQPRMRWLHHKGATRQFYLCSAAAVRQVGNWLRHPESWRAVEVSERFADGSATIEELESAAEAAMGVAWGRTQGQPIDFRPGREEQRFVDAAMAASYSATSPRRVSIPRRGPVGIWIMTYNVLHYAAKSGGSREIGPRQAALLRDIFGNPFRPANMEKNWLAWNDGIVPKIATETYESRDFGRLPILADALEDAGCDNADILAHCRSGREHVRGCWVVDLLLGKS
jgi:hypothetical protein